MSDELEPRKTAGRKPHMPTEDNRALVRRLAGLGVTIDDIATIVKISDQTVRNYYGEEIQLGRAEANLGVARALYKAATREKNPNVVAQMFWLKNRAGWNDVAVGVQQNILVRVELVGGPKDTDHRPIQIDGERL